MRRLSLILALALTFATFTTVNAAVPKSGGSCAKKGLVSIYKNKKYTCIKSGNKFIWDSGIAIQPKNPAPLPSISSTAVPTPSNSPTTQPSATPTGPKSGDNCENIGSRYLIGLSSYLECRAIAKNKLQWFEINKYPTVPVNNLDLGNFKDCQVLDQTGRPTGATPIGYKNNRVQNPSFPTEGRFNIVIAPIDFSDFEGEKLDLNLLDKSARNIERWFSYESNGKLTVKVIVIDHWLRAPKQSQKYNWNHPGTVNPTELSDNQIGQDFVNLIDESVDFSKVGALFVLHPAAIKTIEYGMMASILVNSNEGQISPFLVSTGFQSMRQNGATWALWIHELMHHLGMTGHAPDEIWFLDLMDLQSGFGLSTTTWNQFLIDWLPPSQLYCRTLNNVKRDEITLTSIDSLETGIKSIMIALSSHEVLVIESRRKDFWTSSESTLVSKEVFDGFYGVTIYLVDTKKTNDVDMSPNDPGIYSREEGFDFNNFKFASYLKISSDRPNEFKGVESLNYLMLLNESIVFRGLRISLVSSGDFDTVRIEKV